MSAPKLSPEQQEKAVRLVSQGLPVITVAKRFGVSRTTIHTIVKMAKASA